jgi:Nif-specific regulatory protein
MIQLEVIEGHTPGRVFKLSRDVSFIGRAPANEVALEDAHVSGRHARVVQGLDSATLEDLGSTNGTCVLRGDEQLDLSEVGDAVELQSGDIIQLGSGDELCRLSVSLIDDDDTAHLVSVKNVDSAEKEVPNDPVRLRALYDAQSKIGRAEELDQVLEAIASAIFELIAHATHVTVVLRSGDEAEDGKKKKRKKKKKDAARNYLPVLTRARPEEMGGPSSGGPTDFVPITRSVYRKVLKERSAVLAADAPKQVAASPSLMAASVRSTIAVPLWHGDEILGVIQVDNRDAPGMLKGKDLDLVLILAEQASLGVQRAAHSAPACGRGAAHPREPLPQGPRSPAADRRQGEGHDHRRE